MKKKQQNSEGAPSYIEWRVDRGAWLDGLRLCAFRGSFRMPALYCTRHRAIDGELVLSGTDLVTYVQLRVGTHWHEEGDVLINTRLLVDLLSLLDENVLTVRLYERSLTVELVWSNGSARIPGMDAQMFPVGPDEQAKTWTRLVDDLSMKETHEVQRQIAVAADAQHVRDMYTMVWFGEKTFATDGIRLSSSQTGIHRNVPIHVSSLAVIVRLFDPGVAVDVDTSDDGYQVRVTGPYGTVWTAAGGSQAPAVEKLLEAEPAVRVSVSPRELARALKMARSYGDAVWLDIADGQMRVTPDVNYGGAQDQATFTLDIGDCVGEVDKVSFPCLVTTVLPQVQTLSSVETIVLGFGLLGNPNIVLFMAGKVRHVAAGVGIDNKTLYRNSVGAQE